MTTTYAGDGMQAVVYVAYGPPQVLHLQEVAKPTPRDHEVLIRVAAASVSRGDTIARRGHPVSIRLATGFHRPRQPILGSNLAGEVAAVGPAVRRFQPGDQVVAATGAGFGAHADYLCVPEDGALALKPTNLSAVEAAALCEGGLTALPFLRDHGKLRRGQHVLINGASGAVGTLAVQLAKAFGAEVTGVCGPTSVDLVASLGADTVIDYTTTDFTRAGQTYDIIFDTVGTSAYARCRHALRQGGVYLTTVLSLTRYPSMLWASKIARQRAIVAFANFRPAKEKARDLLVLKDLAEAGTLQAVIDSRYGFEQMAQAHQRVETGHKKGAVVIAMDQTSDPAA